MSSSNPLKKYLRKPEIYIKLPSGGRWWPEGSLSVPPNGEIPIQAMTGHDDLVMRNADGLMNGASSVEVIQSCVPAVLDAWEGPNMDIEYLFIAIRIASYGHEMDMEGKCKKCGETTKYGIDLRQVLGTVKIPDFEIPVHLEDLAVFLKPSSYKLNNLTAQEVFEQQKAIMAVQSANLTLEQKEKILKDSVRKLTDITVNKLIEFVDYILMPDGSRVTEREFLEEFINNITREDFTKLKAGIEATNKGYGIDDLPFKCHACAHEDKMRFEFNPANFFAAAS